MKKKSMEQKIKEIKIEHLRNEYERYVNIISRFDFANFAISSIYYKQLKDNELNVGLDYIENNIKHEDKKFKKGIELVTGVDFGKKITLDDNLKYWKDLVNEARIIVNNFKEDVKNRAVKQLLNDRIGWYNQVERTIKLRSNKHKKKKVLK